MGTQTELCSAKEIGIQTEPKETQTDFVTKTVDVAEVSMYTDLISTDDKETQTEETPAYTPLVQRAANQKLRNELIQIQQELV